LSERQIADGLKHAGCKDVRQFQALWDLQVDGIAGPKTQRTLAFVTAEIVVTKF
jgi:murein L,D-transpeptidase YcbB/YkuD